MKTQEKLRYLEDRWDDRVAKTLDDAELLRYRSNLLGSDLRITNFGGGNTSSKISDTDPLDGTKKSVMWIKGSGGDIGSIQRKGFATLYLEKLHALIGRYRGLDAEDEMVEMYPASVLREHHHDHRPARAIRIPTPPTKGNKSVWREPYPHS